MTREAVTRPHRGRWRRSRRVAGGTWPARAFTHTMTWPMTPPRRTKLLTLLLTLIVLGGLVRLALSDEVVDVAMPELPGEQGPAPLVPASLLAAGR